MIQVTWVSVSVGNKIKYNQNIRIQQNDTSFFGVQG